MTFDLSDFSMTTIGYAEPTLWAAVALASVIAMVAGHIIGVGFGRVRDHWRRRSYGLPASGLVSLLIVVLTVTILDGLFSQYHRGLVCTAFVAPVLLIPALIGVAVESRAWRRAREARVE